ncbi:MAG: glycosyltransferase family 4 protein [Betaproteobacteria bacterium]
MIGAMIAAFCAAAVLAIVARYPRIAPRDLPNERSLHDAPVPRAGGWAIWAGWFVATAWLVTSLPPGFSESSYATLRVAIVALFAISLLDDFRGVAAGWRLAMQAACACGVAATLVPLDAGHAVQFAAIAFVLVAAANFYNFMDGSDGLAGAMTVIGFSALAAGAALDRTEAFRPLLMLAVATLPFLWRNLPRARVFLGDAGSVPLGFLAAAASVAGVLAGTWPAWFPLLVFLPFVADAGVTLARRALRHERVWEPHRSHYYQRLVRLGAGHRGTLAAYGALMLGCGVTAVLCLAWRPGAGPHALAAWIAAIALLFAGIDYHGRQRA